MPTSSANDSRTRPTSIATVGIYYVTSSLPTRGPGTNVVLWLQSLELRFSEPKGGGIVGEEEELWEIFEGGVLWEDLGEVGSGKNLFVLYS